MIFPQAAVSSWNYVIFGNETTVGTVSRQFESFGIKARKIVGFGTGLSTAIICNGVDVNTVAAELCTAVSFNRGAECECTDIAYVQDSVQKPFLESLRKRCSYYQQTSTNKPDSIGILPQESVDFIKHELCTVRNKSLNETKHSIGMSIVVMEDHETTMEYPGPILSVRFFREKEHLSRLIQKDLDDNDMSKSLKTAIFTGSIDEFNELLPFTRAYAVHHNIPTHHMDFNEPHQGVYLLKEFSDEIQVVIKSKK